MPYKFSVRTLQNREQGRKQPSGAATTGRERIMDLQPKGIHQRVPVVLGSKNEVELITRYHTSPEAAAA